MRHERQNENPGRAGNVACNLAALRFTVSVIGVVGADANGDQSLGLLSKAGANTDLVHYSAEHLPTSKGRVVSGSYQLLRLEFEETDDFPLDVTQILVNTIQETSLAEPKAVVSSDYANGVISYVVAQSAIAAGKRLTQLHQPST